MKKLKRAFLIGATATVFGVTSMLPFADAVNRPLVSEASTLATPLPKELKLEKVGGVDNYGMEREQYKINLGNRTGTLVLKLYMTDKYPKSHTDTVYNDAKVKRDGPFGLVNVLSAFDTNGIKGLAMFTRYAKVYENEPNKEFKYINGFTNAGVNKQGERFIALGVYLDKVQNNGVYCLDTPNKVKGLWEVKAYFYDNVNVEKRVFNEIVRYFPLLDKVRWDNAELKHKQIGRLTMLKDTQLLKETDGKFVTARTLIKGEQYRIYGYKEVNGIGYYAVEADHFVKKNRTYAKYETPSKEKLRLVQILYEE
jgi:hypothetical protein